VVAKKFTKADIIDALYEKTGMEKKEIRALVDLFVTEIKTALLERYIIELRGFGTFELKIRKARSRARNPRTGEPVSVRSHGNIVFRSGRELRLDAWNICDEIPE